MKNLKITSALLMAILLLSSCLGDSDTKISPANSFSYITRSENYQLIAKTSEGLQIGISSTLGLAEGDCATLGYRVTNPSGDPDAVYTPDYVNVVREFPRTEIQRASIRTDGSEPTFAPGEEFYPINFSFGVFRQLEAALGDRALFSFTYDKKEYPDLSNVQVHFVYREKVDGNNLGGQYEASRDPVSGDMTQTPLKENQVVFDVYFTKASSSNSFQVETGANTATLFAVNMNDFRSYYRGQEVDNSTSQQLGYIPVTFKLRYTRQKGTGENIELIEESYLGSWDVYYGIFFAFPRPE